MAVVTGFPFPVNYGSYGNLYVQIAVGQIHKSYAWNRVDSSVGGNADDIGKAATGPMQGRHAAPREGPAPIETT